MGQLPQSFIEEVLERTDIVRLIDTRVPLRKKGKDYWACCPFHQEKTPSFSVSPEKQIYYCCGCHAHGNAVGFLMAYERMGFREAVESLADDAGIPMPKDGAPADDGVKPLRAALDGALAVYREALGRYPDAGDYLRRRGLGAAAIERFELGYAPPTANLLLKRHGGSREGRQALLDAGLIVARDDGTFYDRFRGRIIFPIRDGRGRLLGFGGRAIDGRDPKYLNSPETRLFHKGKVLYGLYQAREGIRRVQKVLLVEGYMDVISLHQAGVDHAVAASGTALTAEQTGQLFRAAPELIFCFDGDAAGKAAAWRAVTGALEYLGEGRLLRVLFLPEGEDPDSLVGKEGGAAFTERLAGAQPALDFLLVRLQEGRNLALRDEKARLLHEARPYLARVPDAVLRRLYEDRLAEICGIGRPAPKPSQTGQESLTGVKWMRDALGAGRPRAVPSLLERALVLLLHRPADPLWRSLDRDRLARLAKDESVRRFLRVLDIAVNATHLSTQGLLSRLQGDVDETYYYSLASRPLLRGTEGFGEVPMDDAALGREIADHVAEINRRASKRRLAMLSALVDEAGWAALSHEERRELQELSDAQRKIARGHPGK